MKQELELKWTYSFYLNFFSRAVDRDDRNMIISSPVSDYVWQSFTSREQAEHIRYLNDVITSAGGPKKCSFGSCNNIALSYDEYCQDCLDERADRAMDDISDYKEEDVA